MRKLLFVILLVVSFGGHAAPICRMDASGWMHCYDPSTGASWTIRPSSVGSNAIG